MKVQYFETMVDKSVLVTVSEFNKHLGVLRLTSIISNHKDRNTAIKKFEDGNYIEVRYYGPINHTLISELILSASTIAIQHCKESL
jgi:hypothetical protein